jgi:hypothetical protein
VEPAAAARETVLAAGDVGRKLRQPDLVEVGADVGYAPQVTLPLMAVLVRYCNS